MQARRFWPPIKHKLLYANLTVYSVTIILIIVFHQELIWAQKALCGYMFSGNIPPSEDRLLIEEAVNSIKKEQDIESVKLLLEQALQIEPYSEARLLLGSCYLMQGDDNKALTCYKKCRSADPSLIRAYTNALQVLEKKHDYQAMELLLKEGVEHFRKRVELYQPRTDPNIQTEFNFKAFTIHRNAQGALELLENMQKRLKQSKKLNNNE